MTFNVKKSGCLIATATYGSELTPQVQILRNFRDHRVLQTFAGNQFMHVFNSFYYSFSPNVADAIRGNNGLRDAMHIALYPLIGILQFSERIFTILSFNPEAAVVTAGFIASMFIALIYLVPWALLISFFTKYTPSKMVIKGIGLIWLGSLATILLAELTYIAPIMMIATGAFVLTTMGAIILTALRQLPKISQKLSGLSK